MLEIKNLCISVSDKDILNNINLIINDGEIHVLMGPNGVGKSSITKVLTGDKTYTTKGSILFDGINILDNSMTDIARKGIYLVNQSPIQIEGVTNAEMLRTALNEINEKNIGIFEFNKELESICERMDLDKSFIHREINVGCSGGERKKIEMMHLWMLKPKFIILDEIDSGLDVDALNIIVKSINEYYDTYKPSILIITHEERMIKNLHIDYVHILKDKKLISSGGEELAKEIINKGFKDFYETNTINGNHENE